MLKPKTIRTVTHWEPLPQRVLKLRGSPRAVPFLGTFWKARPYRSKPWHTYELVGFSDAFVVLKLVAPLDKGGMGVVEVRTRLDLFRERFKHAGRFANHNTRRENRGRYGRE